MSWPPRRRSRPRALQLPLQLLDAALLEHAGTPVDPEHLLELERGAHLAAAVLHDRLEQAGDAGRQLALDLVADQPLDLVAGQVTGHLLLDGRLSRGLEVHPHRLRDLPRHQPLALRTAEVRRDLGPDPLGHRRGYLLPCRQLDLLPHEPLPALGIVEVALGRRLEPVPEGRILLEKARDVARNPAEQRVGDRGDPRQADRGADRLEEAGLDVRLDPPLEQLQGSLVDLQGGRDRHGLITGHVNASCRNRPR